MIMVLLVFAKFLNILFEPIFKMGNFMFTPVLSSVSSRDEDEISYWSDSDVTMDALEATFSSSDASVVNNALMLDASKVTFEKVAHIENMLDIYEKVSLVYLLYDDPSKACDVIRDLLHDTQNVKPIEEWSKENAKCNIKWGIKLLEALAIIQNYFILRTVFGYSKEAMNSLCFPFNKYISTSVNKTRKMLFLIFDNLCLEKVKDMFVKIRNEATTQTQRIRLPENSKINYFELHLLDLEKAKFIELNNVDKLAKIFKQMEMDDVADDLRSLTIDKKSAVSPETICTKNFETEKNMFIGKKTFRQDNTNDLSLRNLLPSLPSTSGKTAAVNCYPMNKSKPGICLIINQEYFYRDLKHKDLQPSGELEKREGTKADKRILIETFEKLNFGLDVIVENNRRHDLMLADIQNAANKVTKDHSTFFVVILSHGEQDVVYGANSCKIRISEIQETMCKTNPVLKGKPKVLILQCCQGSKCQTVDDDDDDGESYKMDNPEPAKEVSMPKSADHLTFLATVPGFGAIRHEMKGSWFIQTFCKIIQEKYKSYHFEEICTETIGEVVKKRWNKRGEMRCMVPLKWSTLTKKLYFSVET